MMLNFWQRLFWRPLGRGYHPDPFDWRDRPLDALTLPGTPPPSASVAHPCVVPRSQSSTSSCVGFAWAQALELAWAAQGELTGDLSPLALYFWSRCYHGVAGIDAGTYLRTCAKAAQRFGAPSESAHPFSVRRVNTSPSWTAYRDAYDRRGLRGYYRIAGGSRGTLDGVRRAIASRLPVVAGWSVDKAFTHADGPLVIDRCDGPIVGGHAMVIEGYRADGTFDLLNSWGRLWRNGGRARVTERFVTAGRDLWALDVGTKS